MLLISGSASALLGKDSEKLDVTYWGNVYHGGLRQYFKNLREVKRFLGVFGFHLGLLRPENILEVNPVDLIALETLSLFEPALYAALPAHKALLTGRSGHNSGGRAELQEDCRAILSLASEHRREDLKELMKELFPPVADAFGGMQHGNDFYRQWLGELRVCSPEMFNRYFERSLSPQDVSQAEISRLVGLASDGKAMTKELKRYAADGRLMTALERFGPSIDATLDSANVADVVIALLNVGEDLPDGAPGFFSLPPHWALLQLITRVLQHEKDEDKREQALERAIREADNLSMAVMHVGNESDPESRRKYPERMVIRDTSISRLQQLCVERIRMAASNGQLHQQRELGYLLYRWRDWTSGDEVRAWVSNLSASQVGAIAFLRAFLGCGTSHGLGDKVVRTHWYIKLSDTENFVDSERIESLLANVSLTSLSERDRQAVVAFRKALKRKRDGKTEGDFGWERDEE